MQVHKLCLDNEKCVDIQFPKTPTVEIKMETMIHSEDKSHYYIDASAAVESSFTITASR